MGSKQQQQSFPIKIDRKKKSYYPAVSALAIPGGHRVHYIFKRKIYICGSSYICYICHYSTVSSLFYSLFEFFPRLATRKICACINQNCEDVCNQMDFLVVPYTHYDTATDNTHA